MSLTSEDREALLKAVRSCRVDDGAPVRLIRAGDEGHVTYMVSEAVEQIVARHVAEARAAALNEAAVALEGQAECTCEACGTYRRAATFVRLIANSPPP